MLIYFTDITTGNSVALNPEHIVAVFEVTEGDHKGKTVISIVPPRQQQPIQAYGHANVRLSYQ